MRRHTAKGQALVMTALALGIVLIGAVGLALDTSQLWAHRQMAQVAADAAAQAGILSIFNGTNVGGNAFASATNYSHTCGTSDGITPCAYARNNGFGGSNQDTVVVDVPAAADVGLDPASLSTSDPVNLLRVTITRSVSMWFFPMLGAPSTSNISATATAAVVGVNAPVPIAILHPTLPQSLSTNGNTYITICGGTTQGIQVNSTAANAAAIGGHIDFLHAGPLDDGSCTTGTGANLGVLGGPTTAPGGLQLGTGRWVQPSSVVRDPFENVKAPGQTGGPAIPAVAPAPVSIPAGTHGCVTGPCTEYSPGRYVGGLTTPNNSRVIFKPGLYYMEGGGFKLKNTDGGGGATLWSAMCSGCTADADTGTGMVVYDTGPAGSVFNNNPTGGFTVDTNVRATLQGATLTTTNPQGHTVPGPPYYGILFWEDRTANAHTGNQSHGLGQGNGCFTLIGTIYMTNTIATTTAAPAHYQAVTYNGNPCSTTSQKGLIVVDALSLVGSAQIKMNLEPFGFLTVRKIALVQ